MTKSELEHWLKAFPDVEADTVTVAGDGTFVAKMLVKTFAGVDEAERQERVYEFLRSHLSDDDLQSIEFIITNAPGDLAEA